MTIATIIDDIKNKFTRLQPQENKEDIQKTFIHSSELQKQIQSVFEDCVKINASDLHFCIINDDCIVKARVLGDMTRLCLWSSDKGNSICRVIYTTMCDIADKNFQITRCQNGRINSTYLPKELSGVRVFTTPTDSGFHLVCRFIYKTNKQPDIKQLGYEDFQIEQINEIKAKNFGITIIAGPGDSGKSTTLQAIFSSLITEHDGKNHVMTVEDPVENVIYGQEAIRKKQVDSEGNLIKQLLVDNNGNPVLDINGEQQYVDIIEDKIKCFATQTSVALGRSKEDRSERFAEAILSASRFDPDVMMISELRDSLSISAALRLAISGIRIFTSIHSNNAVGILPRMIDMDTRLKDHALLNNDIFGGFIAQRLVKKICTNCSKSLVENTSDIDFKNLDTVKRLLIALGAYKTFDEIRDVDNFSDLLHNTSTNTINLSKIRIRNHSGCELCNDAGISGRTVIAEIINPDEKYVKLIVTNEKTQAKDYWMKELHGVDMLMHGLIKVKNGLVDPKDLENEIGYIELHGNTDMSNFRKLLERE